MGVQAELAAHLATGATHLCRCWAVNRTDGAVFGFTDHDRDIGFEGILFRADTGLTGQAIQQTTGLSVDNGEALGALSDASVTEADLAAGRFDNAQVRAWLVNWRDVGQRHLLFDGSIGEVHSGGGGFRAELRGLTERLNQPRGRVYQKQCSALLGDAACTLDMSVWPRTVTGQVIRRAGRQEWVIAETSGQPDDWFGRGRIEVLSGAAAGLSAMVKSDKAIGAERLVRLWQEFRAPLAAGDTVRLQAGCDKRADTCREKFGNFENFRGFPHIPGEDWLMAYPRGSGGGSDGS